MKPKYGVSGDAVEVETLLYQKKLKSIESKELLKSSGHKPRKGSVVECIICGKLLYKRQSVLGKKYYLCSPECRVAYQRTNKPFHCRLCGKECYRSKSQFFYRNPKYCSKDCAVKSNTKTDEERLATRRSYYESHKSDYQRRGKLWVKQNPERTKELNRKNRKKPKYILLHRIHQAARRAKKKSTTDGTVTRTSILNLLKFQKGLCVFCGSNIRKRFDVDHIHPIARGGAHTLANIQLLCPSCNNYKRAKVQGRLF